MEGFFGSLDPYSYRTRQ